MNTVTMVNILASQGYHSEAINMLNVLLNEGDISRITFEEIEKKIMQMGADK